MKKFIITLLVGITTLQSIDAYADFEKIWHYHSGLPGSWRMRGYNSGGGLDFWCVGAGFVCEYWDWMTLGTVSPPPDNHVDGAMSAAASDWGIILPSLPTPDIQTVYY